MRKYNPFRNVFYYYRGPSQIKAEMYDKQIEDNTTKAFINTLEHSKKGLLKFFLGKLHIDIRFSKASYDLQIAKERSRPDAVIQLDQKNIYVESKIDSPLEKDQIYRHLESISGSYLVCITPRDEDVNIVKEINRDNLIFTTWKDIYLYFEEYTKKRKNSEFINKQFLEYLEVINMAPFNGWNKKDFEAFLNIDDDPKKELRLRVKEKLDLYLTELNKLIKTEKLFNDLESKVGNINEDSNEVWGVLCKAPLNEKVQKPHFNFWINSDEFGMGIQIEGKKPADKIRNTLKSNPNKFLKISQKLSGFDLIIKKRINPKNIPRAYYGEEIARIKLGKDISHDDIEYIIKKIEKYPLFEIGCAKEIKRNDKRLNNQSFLKGSMKSMKQLKDYYDFSFGNVA